VYVYETPKLFGADTATGSTILGDNVIEFMMMARESDAREAMSDVCVIASSNAKLLFVNPDFAALFEHLLKNSLLSVVSLGQKLKAAFTAAIAA
jgi:hypothetical protein